MARSLTWPCLRIVILPQPQPVWVRLRGRSLGAGLLLTHRIPARRARPTEGLVTLIRTGRQRILPLAACRPRPAMVDGADEQGAGRGVDHQDSS